MDASVNIAIYGDFCDLLSYTKEKIINVHFINILR